MIHIQKMAPGPPTMMAPHAPTMLPVPTWAAIAVDNAWNDVMPPPWLPPRRLKLPNTRRQPSPKQRNWIALVRTVNQMPMPSSRMIRM